LHHFENTKLLISKLNEKLSIGGEIISYDPLQTSIPIKILRYIYRPFQSDSDWEWPFTKKTLRLFELNFNVLEKRGILGYSKWILLFNVLPFKESYKLKIGKKYHRIDWDLSAINNKKLYNCMHLTMRMRKNM